MEKSSAALSEQIRHLKKSLKNKRNVEIWQQCIQFYRNNQSSLGNYHILKLLKIAMKPLKSTIMKNCRYLHKLAVRQSKRQEDKKLVEEIEDQRQFLHSKLRVLLKLLDSYTLAMQAVLTTSDPIYFTMMHRKNYHALHPHKELIFEPLPPENEAPLKGHKLEHQMSGFLNFVCQAAILFATGLLCLGGLGDAGDGLFAGLDRGLGTVFASESRFATRKLEYQCLRLNYLTKYPSSRLQVPYTLPLQTFHLLYKYHRKWQLKQLKRQYNLLLRYLFFCLLNLPSQAVTFSCSRPPSHDPALMMQTQIYIYMKEMLNLYRVVRYKLDGDGDGVGKGVARGVLEFMSVVVDLFEAKVEEMRVWGEMLTRYFPYRKLMAMDDTMPRQDSQTVLLKQLTSMTLAKKQEAPTKLTLSRKIQHKKRAQKHREKQQTHDDQIICEKFMDLFDCLGTGMTGVFSMIQESDEEGDEGDEEENKANKKRHLFQKWRRQEIQEIQKDRAKVKRGDKQGLRQRSFTEFMDRQEAQSKLQDLQKKNLELSRQSEVWLQKLHNRRINSKYQSRLSMIEEQTSRVQESMIPQPNAYTLPQLQFQKPATPNPLLSSIRSGSRQKQNPELRGQAALLSTGPVSLLPSIQKQSGTEKGHTREQQKQIKKFYPVTLSDKYDRMSRNLLLSNTNTNRQRNYDL